MQLFRDKFGIESQEREVDRTELYIADEAFFCGTGSEITPISSVDRHPLGDGKVGPLTTKLMEAYFGVVRGLDSSYRDWCFPVY